MEPFPSTGHPTSKRFLRHCSRIDTLPLYPESPSLSTCTRRLSRVSRPRLTFLRLDIPFCFLAGLKFHPFEHCEFTSQSAVALARTVRGNISTMVYDGGSAIIHGLVVRRCAGSGRVVVLIAGRRVHDTRILVALLNTRCYV